MDTSKCPADEADCRQVGRAEDVVMGIDSVRERGNARNSPAADKRKSDRARQGDQKFAPQHKLPPAAGDRTIPLGVPATIRGPKSSFGGTAIAGLYGDRLVVVGRSRHPDQPMPTARASTVQCKPINSPALG